MNKLQRYTWLILAIIPLAYLFIGFHFNLLIGIFSLRNMDPEYIYFLSGLGFANGHIHIGHFDNPGTPLQLLIALTYRIVYWFRPGEVPLLDDVFRNSDHYLNMANHLVLTVVALTLFICGKQVYRITKNIAYALLIQTAPFYSEITYDIVGRLIPELLMPIPVLIFSILLLRHIFDDDQPFNRKTLLFLALTAGFGLSIKMTFIPFWIIPLFIIPGVKKKFAYLGLSVVAFLIIAFPVTQELKTFYSWIKNLVVHSGNYGSGDANFIDFKLFFGNLREIWNSTETLFYLLGSLLISCILYFFIKKKNERNWKIIAVSAGVFLAIVLQIALSSKHYSYRYIIPSLAFLPMLAILTFELLNRIIDTKWNKYVILTITLLAFIPGIHKQNTSAQIRNRGIGEEMARKRVTWHYAQAIPDSTLKIIVSQGYGAPYQDYVITYSTAWAGPRMKDYREVLARLYPHSYMYNTWDDKVQAFGNPFNARKIAQENKPIALYLEHDTPELMERTMQKFFLTEDSVEVSKELIFSNAATNEGLYWLLIKPAFQTTPAP